MKARKVMAILTAVCMSVSMAGVVSAAEENSGADPSTIEKAAEDSSVKIGVLMKTMSDAYSNKLGTAIQDYVEKNYPNAELYLMDGQADIAKQISQAEDIIAKQVDVIILNPQDADGSAQVLTLAADADIPVVEVNTETTSTDYVSYVGSNDSEAGEMMGNYVMEQLGDGGQYAILEGEMGQSAQLLRYQGLEETILKDDKYECVGTLSASWQRDKAMSTTEDWIGKYPDLKAVICENDDMSMGALQAAEAEGKDLVIIGVDGISDALQAVKDGRLSASVLQDADGQASAVIDVAVKVGVGEEVYRKGCFHLKASNLTHPVQFPYCIKSLFTIIVFALGLTRIRQFNPQFLQCFFLLGTQLPIPVFAVKHMALMDVGCALIQMQRPVQNVDMGTKSPFKLLVKFADNECQSTR